MCLAGLTISKGCAPAEPVGTRLREHCKEGMTLNLICSTVPAPGKRCLTGTEPGLSNKLLLSSKSYLC